MKNKTSSVAWWPLAIAFLVFLMVIIGGITRLTDSGLSMVDWRPLMGAIPPLNEHQWMEVFHRYKQYPEYLHHNQGMTLLEFKRIFFWEYFHRLVGRLIGIVFLVPWIYFNLKKKLNFALNKKFAVAFILGGLQGLLGWFMVKSGLVLRPDVSHFRLAAHLLLAFFILGYLFWIILDLMSIPKEKKTKKQKKFRSYSWSILMLVILQIAFGAFTAGVRAGFFMNTFPLRDGQWFPTGYLNVVPVWKNFVENPIHVQFVHRTLGWVVLFAIISFFIAVRKARSSKKYRIGATMLLHMTLLQFLLGVGTLVMAVPIPLAVIHQLGAGVLFLIAIYNVKIWA